MTVPGLIVAAPRSGAGKTTVALGLMRAYSNRGIAVQPFKNGPDYIDPVFHRRAAGRKSFNLDTWAMPEGMIGTLAGRAESADLAIAEGSMGLFDGAGTPGASGTGATADIAALTGWPVILVLDVSGQAQSAAAVALGCARLRSDLTIAGTILNKVASERHERLVRQALAAASMPVLGAIRRDGSIELPERHLGLVQAGEIGGLDARLDALAAIVETSCNLDEVIRAAARHDTAVPEVRAITPPAQRIALADDAAFSFVYPHLAEGWRRAGAEIVPFSPLGDEAPPENCDVCWLPGGYPELHAGKLAAARTFMRGLAAFTEAHPVHGECGGFMVLGQGLTDTDGTRHEMAGLLEHDTSFAERKLHLGYRAAHLIEDGPLGRAGSTVRGHEFHYATISGERGDEPMAELFDGDGKSLGPAGSRRGHVSGAFFHMIAAAP